MSKKGDENRRNRRWIMRNELVLAEMIANAEDLGLPFRETRTGLVADNGRFVPERWPTGRAVGCCAIGAYMACRRVSFYDEYTLFTRKTRVVYSSVYRGNDGSVQEWDNPDHAVGVAYRAYHTVNK